MKYKLLPLFLLLLTLCGHAFSQDKKDSANTTVTDSTSVTDGKTVFSIFFGKYPKHRKGYT